MVARPAASSHRRPRCESRWASGGQVPVGNLEEPERNRAREFFGSVEGSIHTKRPLYLGHGVVSSPPDGPQARFFSGGGIADLRVFNRRITAHEAKVVSQWPVAQRARDKTPEELDALEREALRLYYLAVGDSKADETLPAVESAA